MWRELVSFFPEATPFKVESAECLECLGEVHSGKRAEAAVKRERQQEIALPVLRTLYSRKNGVSFLYAMRLFSTGQPRRRTVRREEYSMPQS